MTAPAASVDEDRALRGELDRAASAYGFASEGDELVDEFRVVRYRQRRRRVGDDPVATLSLVERDGVLVWEEGSPSFARSRRRARRADGGRAADRVVGSYRFPRLEPNEITRLLEKLDERLTPQRGLRQVRVAEDAQGVRYGFGPATVPPDGRVLLLLHGTFSDANGMLSQLQATEEGRRFLIDASKRYAAMFIFDHPTLSVGPLLNAFDLQAAFAGKRCEVDVIAHSRGGLVARWWLEGFDAARAQSARAVFLGCPLHGTGLAAPPRLRSAMSLLTNYGRVLQTLGETAAAVPLLHLPLVLLKAVGSITSLLAQTPVLDAAVAMIPGLACQSRVSNNGELLRIRATRDMALQYYAVRSNFEPDDVGWRFWRLFRGTGAADLGADAVFGAENDLVVDTASMTDIADRPLADARVHDFGKSRVVHHLNYLRQPATLEFLRGKLFTATA